ncbi:efflux transporter outer membrane subunit [uncultured Nitrosomonas sp.]|uniref:efflux transporter outer membrane subunit n=1 Tax=uncultured Nitrosomonas sp. TaxID=156424 RepID=UPI0025FDFE47|nr:efflux transporter outer membrane subunit [uncultured Nitrosomonas sp.]
MVKTCQAWKTSAGLLLLMLVGCTTLGPDFKNPEAPLMESWQHTDATLSNESLMQVEWWELFDDPILDTLIQTAYQQNLPLQIAGLRIIESRAQLGIAVGRLFPQFQEASGSFTHNEISENAPNVFSGFTDTRYRNAQIGFDAAWELDFWGRFRRGIESARANFAANVADYDNALVSLAAEVARAYITIRTLEERLTLAQNNIVLQRESLRIARVRFENGATSELDLQQATYNLANTQALVPLLRRALRQAKNSLSVLLGMPPNGLRETLGENSAIPRVPPTVATGIPADLLRRRPDVRQAENLAARQSALIGVAKAELFPRFSITGAIGFQASDFASTNFSDLLDTESMFLTVGPSFRWNILNYGRISNNVRVQDARFQQSIVNYQNTVLKAYQEVEDALVAFLQAQLESNFRATSVAAAQRAVEIARIQYREGTVNFQRVIDSERALVEQQDRWVSARGDILLNLIAMFKALGGGWEIRENREFISEQHKQEMQDRTSWGNLLQDSDGPEKGSMSKQLIDFIVK